MRFDVKSVKNEQDIQSLPLKETALPPPDNLRPGIGVRICEQRRGLFTVRICEQRPPLFFGGLYI